MDNVPLSVIEYLTDWKLRNKELYHSLHLEKRLSELTIKQFAVLLITAAKNDANKIIAELPAPPVDER